jgi:hypothetical protein
VPDFFLPSAQQSTFCRQMRLLYDPIGIDAEREAYRLVILLCLVTTCRTLLTLLEQSANTTRGRIDVVLLRRMRLAPVLSLEDALRRSLGVIGHEAGVSSPSFEAHAQSDRASPKPLSWRESVPLLRQSMSHGGLFDRDEDMTLSDGDDDTTSSHDSRKGQFTFTTTTHFLPARWSRNVTGGRKRAESHIFMKADEVDEETTALIRERKSVQEAAELVACSKDEVSVLMAFSLTKKSSEDENKLDRGALGRGCGARSHCRRRATQQRSRRLRPRSKREVVG